MVLVVDRGTVLVLVLTVSVVLVVYLCQFHGIPRLNSKSLTL